MTLWGERFRYYDAPEQPFPGPLASKTNSGVELFVTSNLALHSYPGNLRLTSTFSVPVAVGGHGGAHTSGIQCILRPFVDVTCPFGSTRFFLIVVVVVGPYL